GQRPRRRGLGVRWLAQPFRLRDRGAFRHDGLFVAYSGLGLTRHEAPARAAPALAAVAGEVEWLGLAAGLETRRDEFVPIAGRRGALGRPAADIEPVLGAGQGDIEQPAILLVAPPRRVGLGEVIGRRAAIPPAP